MKKIVATALILILLAGLLPAQAQTIALQYCPDANSRAVYWLEDATDQTSNNYDLINVGTVIFTAGKFNNAADLGLNNNSKYLWISNGALGYSGGDLTFSIWVKIRTEPATDTNQELIQIREQSTSNTELGIRYKDVGGIKKLHIYRTRTGIITATATYDVTLGITNWHHIVMTYNNTSGVAKLYLDNVDTGATFTQTGTGTTFGGSQFALGIFVDAAGIPATSFAASAYLDEVVVSSSVFSSTDVANIFNRANPPIGCPAPAPVAEGNLWQKRSFEGKGFITTTNEITITPATETNFALIRNPAASGKLHRSNDFALTVRTEGQNVRVRIYKNPTITVNGTPVAVNNVRTSGNSLVSQVFTLPITTLPGQLIATFSRNADSLNRSFDLSLYLEPGESYLITVQGTAAGNDYILTYTFVEE